VFLWNNFDAATATVQEKHLQKFFLFSINDPLKS